jgi:hypothetical protein
LIGKGQGKTRETLAISKLNAGNGNMMPSFEKVVDNKRMQSNNCYQNR